MTIQKGKQVLIKIGNAGSPETFATIGGLVTTKFALHNQLIDATNIGSGAWRQLVSSVGTQSISLGGTGIFTDAASEETVRGCAFANSVRNYEFDFGGNDKFVGPFQIAQYERAGNVDGIETYAITFESAGALTVTIA